jgi:hypothetical protein
MQLALGWICALLYIPSNPAKRYAQDMRKIFKICAETHICITTITMIMIIIIMIIIMIIIIIIIIIKK